jgi:uncharacterized protein YybS (DUF2232 family)
MDGTLSASVAGLVFFIAAALSGNPLGLVLQAAVDAGLASMAATLGDQMDLYKAALDLLVTFFPSSVVIGSAVAAYLEYQLLSRVVKRVDGAVLRMPPLREFTWPRQGIYGWMLMFLLAYLAKAGGFPAGGNLLMNIENIFQTAFALQGTACLLMVLLMRRVPKGLAAGLAVAAWIFPYGKMALFLLGLADIMFGIRMRISQR